MEKAQDERLKIFLAEDEFVVREGIKNNIDWNSHGFEFVGEASDGELALPLIQKEKPDILITDIRMPFMDGLELSRIVKQELPGTEIIILSGFEEFEYAREAIKIGVAEYLTKPISATDLLKEIEKVGADIIKRREEARLRAQYLAEMQESVRLEKKELFKNLVSGGVSISEIIKLAERVNVSITALKYSIILLKFTSDRHGQNEFSGSIVKADDETEALAGSVGAISFDRTPEGKAYLLLGDSDEDINSKIEIFTGGVARIVASFPSVSFFGGIGKTVGRISEIPDSYQVAGRAFALRYFEKADQFAKAQDINPGTAGTAADRDDLSVNEINSKQVNRAELEGFLKIGSVEEVEYFVDAYFRELGENAINSTMFRQYIAMNAYFAVSDFIESIGKSRDSIETFNAGSDCLKNVTETAGYVARIFTEAINIRERISNSRYNIIVDDVCAYVEENYAVMELSLNDIAAHVNFSPSHLSMVFSQETGKTLIKYITDVRMTKAKELLKCTSKRSSEIAALVGYQDPHYFSYLFKKTQGMTPTDFRSGKEADDTVTPAED